MDGGRRWCLIQRKTSVPKDNYGGMELMYLPKVFPLLSRTDDFLPRERFLEFHRGAANFSINVLIMLRFYYFEGLSNQILVYEMNHTRDYGRFLSGLLAREKIWEEIIGYLHQFRAY